MCWSTVLTNARLLLYGVVLTGLSVALYKARHPPDILYVLAVGIVLCFIGLIWR